MTGAVRQIRFTVTADTVMPDTPQEAGIRGEHNATEVIFSPSGALLNEEYRYRVEVIDGAGAYDTSELLTLTDGQVSLRLPLAWTAAGGVAQIRLSAVRLDAANAEEMVAFSPAGKLVIAPRGEGAASTQTAFSQGLAGLIAEVTTAAGEAAAQAAAADRAAEGAARAAAGADEAADAARSIHDSTVTAQGQIAAAVALFTGTTAPEAAARVEAAGRDALAAIDARGTQVQQAVAAQGEVHTRAAAREADRAAAEAAAAQQAAEQASTQAGQATAAADRAEQAAARIAAIDPYGKAEADARFAPALLGTAAGAIAHMDDVAALGALTRAVVYGGTAETGIGDKGPDNPYTISGATPTALTIDDGTHTQTLPLPTLDPLYGNGTLYDAFDAVSGALTRRWGRVVLDGTERWSGQADGAAYLLSMPDKYQRYGMDGLVCSHYPTRGTTQPYHGIDNNWGSLRFWVTAEHATLADWQAYLAAEAAAGRPVTVLYELAEPVVIQLESQTIIPPAPVCNLYADAGSVAAGYRRDLTLAFAKLEQGLAQ